MLDDIKRASVPVMFGRHCQAAEFQHSTMFVTDDNFYGSACVWKAIIFRTAFFLVFPNAVLSGHRMELNQTLTHVRI